MARCFVAAYPPGEVLDAIERLPRHEAPGVRWVPRTQWHVTLRFLGEADPAEALARLAGLRAGPAEATLGPVVSRLGRDVLCLPVAGLDALADAVAGATAGVGEPPDPRGFTGHLTLARLRNRAACGLAGAPFAARFVVDEVALVRSTLGAAGARHEVVGRVALTAA